MTFSIVARDKRTGQMGVAVQSHWFSVGSMVPWARPGIGAVATQATAEASYGPLGLGLMAAGKSAEDALKALVTVDKGRDLRQVAFVDSKGTHSAHTGEKCCPAAGHTGGDQFSCQGNVMRSDSVWKEMAKEFTRNSKLEFANRLMAVLEAGHRAGGDIRGRQSAAILVVGGELAKNYWDGVILDLRVEDNPDPIPELKRLLRLHKSYTWALMGRKYLAEGKNAESIEAY